MLDPINEIIERFLVALGLTLNRLSDEETGMVSMLLAIAAVASRALRAAYFGR